MTKYRLLHNFLPILKNKGFSNWVLGKRDAFDSVEEIERREMDR